MARSHEIPHERTSPKDERTFAPPLPAPLPAATIDRGVAPRFVALVAQALGCRHCWIRLVGSDGDVLTDDAFDALHDDGAPWSDLPRAPFDDERIAFRSSSASMHLPVELADGTAGEVVVAGGHAFGAADVASLDQLVRSYVATYDDTAWREVRRLRVEVKEMRRQATSIKERERDRLARELHDDVGHAITTAPPRSLDSIAKRRHSGPVVPNTRRWSPHGRCWSTVRTTSRSSRFISGHACWPTSALCLP